MREWAAAAIYLADERVIVIPQFVRSGPTSDFLEPREVDFAPQAVGPVVWQALEDSVCVFPDATELPEEPTMTLRKYRKARSWKAAYRGLASCSVYRNHEMFELFTMQPAPDGRRFWGEGEPEVFTKVEELGQRVVDALRESERHP